MQYLRKSHSERSTKGKFVHCIRKKCGNSTSVQGCIHCPSTSTKRKLSKMILARALLHQCKEHLELTSLLPGGLCGLQKDRGTKDMIFVA